MCFTKKCNFFIRKIILLKKHTLVEHKTNRITQKSLIYTLLNNQLFLGLMQCHLQLGLLDKGLGIKGLVVYSANRCFTLNYKIVSVVQGLWRGLSYRGIWRLILSNTKVASKCRYSSWVTPELQESIGRLFWITQNLQAN